MGYLKIEQTLLLRVARPNSITFMDGFTLAISMGANRELNPNSLF